MRSYTFFPGCSLEATASAYGDSIEAVAGPLGMELIEVEDWNCCGSTPYGSTNEVEAICIAARNLALAEKSGLDLVTPCSACYTTLLNANSVIQRYPDMKDRVNDVLAAAGLEYGGKVRVRHLAEVIYTDIGLEAIESKVVRRLEGLKVAPYYGCQLVRPHGGFDDPEYPRTLDRLIVCLGAEDVPFPLKSRCCGGSLIIPEPKVALGLINKILGSAAENGADCIITPCPLCQTNLDAYQGIVNATFKTKYEIPILFFTQLLGLALGIDAKALGLAKGMVSARQVLAPYAAVVK